MAQQRFDLSGEKRHEFSDSDSSSDDGLYVNDGGQQSIFGAAARSKFGAGRNRGSARRTGSDGSPGLDSDNPEVSEAVARLGGVLVPSEVLLQVLESVETIVVVLVLATKAPFWNS